mmetsp:Transcript_11287/g.18659  ORF Transcript_11287/g.18659 Transcript_11287/m.18659 type:complete len:920 (-) Transcript_11287:39-2798(-)
MTMARTMVSKRRKKVLLLTTLAALACLLFTVCLTTAAEAVAVAEDSGNNDDIIDNNEEPPPSGDNRNGQSNSQQSSPSQTLPLLDSHSVVLITGAAGFIGSELALALKRTYNVKKLLLVDHMGMASDNESIFVPPPKNADGKTTHTYTTKKAYERYDRDALSLFELKRQRIFRVFQELTAVDLDDNDDYDDTIQNNNAADSIKFYRADMRPSIPEFFDMGELPVLEGIFGSHPDITHVVHLADDDVNGQNQAIIPRNRDSVKAGRMEGILEELRLILERREAEAAKEAHDKDNEEEDEGKVAAAYRLPQFVYASSYEVYDYLSTSEDSEQQQHQPNPLPFREDKPITTPSSLHGASKLIDEILASAYHSTHGIFSVGLRFFPVYGPWGNPDTDIYDLAEELCCRNFDDDVDEDSIHEEKFDEDVKDYVYIDDAVDAIMSAMQYRPPAQDPSPVVFNVGTGEGSSLKQIRDEIMVHFPPNSFDNQTIRSTKQRYNSQRQATISYASTELSNSHLGFKAQVPLSVGLANTVAWLRDRSTPFGRDSKVSTQQKRIDSFVGNSLAKATREECSPFDRECLRGTPVFPCASECSKAESCTPSSWDDAASLSRLVTNGCDAVMFTILLDKDAEQIPSATASNVSFVGAGLPDIGDVGKQTNARCNIAFVSEDSPLVQRLRSEGKVYTDSGNNDLPEMVRHGFWTLLPVRHASSGWMHAFSGSFALGHLPKLSPGQFFGSSVRYAIFVDPSVLIADIPEILKQMDRLAEKDSVTAMIAMERRKSCDASDRKSTCSWMRPKNNDSIQRMMHNMVRVSLKGDLLGGELTPVIDSSFLVHSLHGEDAKMLRCDVYSDAAQWGASSDESSLEFILSLHDFWSRAGSYWSSGDSLDPGSAKEETSLLWVLSSSDTQFFTQIISPDGVIQVK